MYGSFFFGSYGVKFLKGESTAARGLLALAVDEGVFIPFTESLDCLAGEFFRAVPPEALADRVFAALVCLVVADLRATGAFFFGAGRLVAAFPVDWPAGWVVDFFTDFVLLDWESLLAAPVPADDFLFVAAALAAEVFLAAAFLAGAFFTAVLAVSRAGVRLAEARFAGDFPADAACLPAGFRFAGDLPAELFDVDFAAALGWDFLPVLPPDFAAICILWRFSGPEFRPLPGRSRYARNSKGA